MSKDIVLTGDRPSGRLHLGHYIGSLKNRVLLQDSTTQFIMIADIQALTDNFDNPSVIKKSVYEIASDYIASGIDPQKSTIFIQSQLPELAELTIYYMNLVSIARLHRNPTVKAEIAQKSIASSISPGFLCYPISQAADITAFKATIVPVGEDQLPMIELTNEIVTKFNRIYNTDCLVHTTAQLSKTPRLIGIDGKAKASKSLNNAIYLSDSPQEIRDKVFSMYTDPLHIKVSDPGSIEGNVVFSYLDAFCDDVDHVDSLKAQYRKGGLGDTVIKSFLNDVLQKMLTPIREKRETVNKKQLDEFLQIGCMRAKQVAQQTLDEVKNAIGTKYHQF